MRSIDVVAEALETKYLISPVSGQEEKQELVGQLRDHLGRRRCQSRFVRELLSGGRCGGGRTERRVVLLARESAAGHGGSGLGTHGRIRGTSHTSPR
ncbi:MAG: hypothetical protein IIC01_04795 [Planctomycetes bacterium]|nr:hypothetical protein [Planctomycetota bacterium]